jgi:hypothetical protein
LKPVEQALVAGECILACAPKDPKDCGSYAKSAQEDVQLLKEVEHLKRVFHTSSR